MQIIAIPEVWLKAGGGGGCWNTVWAIIWKVASEGAPLSSCEQIMNID